MTSSGAAAAFEDTTAAATVDRGHGRSARRTGARFRRGGLRLGDGRVGSIVVPMVVEALLVVLGGIGRRRLLGTYGGTHFG